jgi:hypothetical protein
MYCRNVQSGVRARRDLIHAMNTQRVKDEKTIVSLERDRTALLNMRADIQVYMRADMS